MAGKPIWWFALFFVWIIGIILAAVLAAIDPTGGILVAILMGVCILIPVVTWLFICLGVASARGKSVFWGILLFLYPCLSPFGWAYLGLSK